jgi:hypothetical protein
MTDETKKFLAIAATVICFVIAGTISYKSFFGNDGGGTATGEVVLLCTACGGFEIPVQEFQSIISKNAPDGMMAMPGFGPVAIICPKCNKKTCYIAEKCQKCENIFVLGQAKDPQFPDRCPKCKFSQYDGK